MSQPLKGIQIALDVRNEGSDVAAAFRDMAAAMGAVCRKQLGKNVAYLVFKDGSKKRVSKARELGIIVVKTTWLTTCRDENALVPHKPFLLSDDDIASSKQRNMRPTPLKVSPNASFQNSETSPKAKLAMREEDDEIEEPEEEVDEAEVPVSPHLEADEEETVLESPKRAAGKRTLKTYGKADSPAKKNVSLSRKKLDATDAVPKDATIADKALSSKRRSFENSKRSPNKKSKSPEKQPRMNDDGFLSQPPSATKIASSSKKRQASPMDEASRKQEIDEGKPGRKRPLSEDNDDNAQQKQQELKGSNPDAKRFGSDEALDTPNKTHTSRDKQVVLSGLADGVQAAMLATIPELGTYVIKEGVTSQTTHIISSGKRTAKVLDGISRGCWIVSAQWVEDSAAAGKWLPETNYEMIKEFPAAKANRLRKITSTESTPVFHSVKAFFSPEVTPDRSLLCSIFRRQGGHVAKNLEDATLCVGAMKGRAKPPIPTIAEKWLFDSLSSNKYEDISNYIIS